MLERESVNCPRLSFDPARLPERLTVTQRTSRPGAGTRRSPHGSSSQNAAYTQGPTTPSLKRTNPRKRHQILSKTPAESDRIDVRLIRANLGMSQEEFARRFRLSVGAIREWEQGRRRPDLAACTLLRVIAHNPQAVADAPAAPHDTEVSTSRNRPDTKAPGHGERTR